MLLGIVFHTVTLRVEVLAVHVQALPAFIIKDLANAHMGAVIVGVNIIPVFVPAAFQDVVGAVAHAAQTEACLRIYIMLVCPLGHQAAACVMGVTVTLAAVVIVQFITAFAVFTEDTVFQCALLQLPFSANSNYRIPGVHIHMAACLVTVPAAADGYTNRSSIGTLVRNIPQAFQRLAHMFSTACQQGHTGFHGHYGLMGLF